MMIGRMFAFWLALMLAGSAWAQSNTVYQAPWGQIGTTVTLTASNSSSRVALTWQAAGSSPPPSSLWVHNGGLVDVYIALGDVTVTATTSGVLVAAGGDVLVALNNATYLAGITASSTATLSIAAGIGSPLAKGGGGGSGMTTDGANATSAALDNIATAAGGTVALTNAAQTWSAVQSINSGDLALKGATSGSITLNAAATAGSNTITLPAGTTDFSATGGTSQVVKQTSAGGAFTVARLACADLSNAGSGCSGSAKAVAQYTSIATNLTNSGTSYIGQNTGTNEVNVRPVALPAGTFKNLFCALTGALTQGSYAFTVRDSTTTTDGAVTCTISNPGQTCSDITHTFAITPASTIDLTVVKIVASGTPNALPGSCNVEFDPS